MLAIQNQHLRLGFLQFYIFNWTHLEANFSPSLQQHNRTNGKRTGNTDQQRPDMLIIPYPPSLEIRQLYPSISNLPQDIF
ncbi:Uncharacterised protein [Salmonella enterica subsp. enterica serovar Bovismorbificans]|uniref:Uncharacterized protein n=1 Tax=Salmonella enterica subsp. enterica serovar Bovismorbificans TaxID=58097 RepID=A0A655D9D4_SALET|nr:Uncharacterised protein [Salmonella enterica subsp. enterica serovar Bovismorbificans]CNU51793.1 Uncharacterised protein [Salmonella enterica subsp. enterica serovar Bovismorbificans]CNU52428.1 Uncharacterised protein [Salmonella enterica subsp. enterica serovar Bovismorbificans]CNU55165.1 Uncharacterised protein [Salmonella enterica subsp. enterica serovar Bovismorbificans]CNU69979.1 Uncharacterised protein [Salmonella enterica subsp. enterica serovar Bovismorbificans]